MRGTVHDFLQVIHGEVGYVEGPNNWTKYGEWADNQNTPWCGQFITWCLAHAEVKGDWLGIDSQADVSAALERWRSLGRVVYKPRRGDLVWFNWPGGEYVDHMGAVIDPENWSQGILITGEGNASDGVRIKTRYAQNVVAFARPQFSVLDPIADEDRLAISTVVLYKGMKNHARLIKALQNVLGGITVDGVFGFRTENRVKRFQKNHGLVVDGIVGPRTKRALTE